jgi:hypothetical protein
VRALVFGCEENGAGDYKLMRLNFEFWLLVGNFKGGGA